MSTTIAIQLREFASRQQAADGTSERPPAVTAALSLLPFRRLFAVSEISAKIQEFVYTFY